MATAAIISATVLCLSPKKWGMGSCKALFYTWWVSARQSLAPATQKQKINDSLRKAPPSYPPVVPGSLRLRFP